jgi:spermidine synthase
MPVTEAQLVFEPARSLWTLFVDGVPQSAVDPNDPRRLELPYLAMLATVVDALPRVTHVLHLGGGALTLPRYVAATRPGSHQVVVDHDADLMDLVRRQLPLEPGADVTIAIADARDYVDAATGEFDLIVGDVYEGVQMPTRVAGLAFARAAVRMLGPTGVYALNVVDAAPLTQCRVQAATLRAVAGEVCLVAERAMLRGRRDGNVILVAGRPGERLPVEQIAWRAGRTRSVLSGSALTEFIGGARPLSD